MGIAQRVLVILGSLALLFCAASYFEARFFQAYENRQFEESLIVPASATKVTGGPGVTPMVAYREGSPVSRMEIPRLELSVMVVEGVRSRELQRAAGHVPGTALPDESGNVAIAAHRDTFFRKLRDIRTDDVITLTTISGAYRYAVEWTRIVGPGDLDPLRSSREPVLTLITCYPFHYLGPAPQRFIVRARRMGSD